MAGDRNLLKQAKLMQDRMQSLQGELRERIKRPRRPTVRVGEAGELILVGRTVARIRPEDEDTPAAPLGLGEQAVELAALVGEALCRAGRGLDTKTLVNAAVWFEQRLVAARIIADQHATDDDAAHADDFPGVEDTLVVVEDRVERLAESDPGFEFGWFFGHGC